MIKKIVLTGEPSSGKTTITHDIVSYFTKKGLKVFVIPETATEVIHFGLKSFGEDPIDIVDFQEIIMRMQLAKESIYDRAVELYLKSHPNKDVLLIYDRGLLDNAAYVNKEGFLEVLDRLQYNKSILSLLQKYDGVIHLVGKKEFYTLLTNDARSEDFEKAHALGEKTLKSWAGHKKLHIVLPKDKLEEKSLEVIGYIESLLIPKQIKKQEKYLIDLSSTELNKLDSFAKAVQIEQTYLLSESPIEKRVRKISFQDKVLYEFSVYRKNENGEKEIVREQEISETFYRGLLEFKDTNRHTIFKQRNYFCQEGECFYIDVFLDNLIGLLEVDVSNKNKIDLPNLPILSNVTFDPHYQNREMALNIPQMVHVL